MGVSVVMDVAVVMGVKQPFWLKFVRSYGLQMSKISPELQS